MGKSLVSDEKKASEEKRRELWKELDSFNRLWHREDTETFALFDYEFVDIHLVSGETIVCRIIEWGRYVAFVEFVSKSRKVKALIHKSQIKMVVIREKEGTHD